jgi:periplasmic nitrate reductase NapD
MSILGAVIRLRPEHLDAVTPRLHALAGVDLALNPGDGRLVLVLEDVEINGTVHEAATTLDRIAQWPEVLNTSLVYEYSGPDAPAAQSGVRDYRDWRGRLEPDAPAPFAPPTHRNDDLPAAGTPTRELHHAIEPT